MRDGQGCLLPVRRRYHIPEEDQHIMVQLLLPQICKAEAFQHLHDVKSRSPPEEKRKKPRRARPNYSSKLAIRVSDSSTLQNFSCRAEEAGTPQDVDVMAGKMVAVKTCSDIPLGPPDVGVMAGEMAAVKVCSDIPSGSPDGAREIVCISECSINKDQEGSGKSDKAHNDEDVVDKSYIPGLPDSVALICLAYLPLTQHRGLALLSHKHRELVSDSLLLKLRHQYQIAEQWICIYTSGNNGWTAFDPKQNRWRNLPPATVDPNFNLSDKESLAAGTHLLWFGQEVAQFACYKYDLVSNSWERGPHMVNPRCLFGSATCGEFAYVAGGFSVGGMQLNALNTAERYDSLKGIWEPLPPMSTPRQKCSGFFMDRKFYVIGGKTGSHELLTSGEEYDPVKNVWRTIENMYTAPDRTQSFEPSPPLVAVADNELYAIESSSNLLKVYDKRTNTWKDLGHVPVRADFRSGWGLAFKALGNQLFVIGGHRIPSQGEGVAVFSWRPQPGAAAPEWQLVNFRVTGTGSFLFNCAIMAC
eukprot:c16490_g1_i2 orf=774-2360(+)